MELRGPILRFDSAINILPRNCHFECPRGAIMIFRFTVELRVTLLSTHQLFSFLFSVTYTNLRCFSNFMVTLLAVTTCK